MASQLARARESLERVFPSAASPLVRHDASTLPIRIVDPKQPHLWLETCAVCNGMFFDAGEFRDWKHETLLDLVRGWFAKPR